MLERLQENYGNKIGFTVLDESGSGDRVAQVSDDLQPYIQEIRAHRYNEVSNDVDDKVNQLRAEGLFDSERGRRALTTARTASPFVPAAGNSTSGSGSGSSDQGSPGDGGGNGEAVPGQPQLGSPLLALILFI